MLEAVLGKEPGVGQLVSGTAGFGASLRPS